MGKYKNNGFMLRIDNELQEKIRILTNEADRPITKQYERIVRKYIEEYEAEHGEIKLPKQEEK